MNTKRCPKCGETKSIEDFYNNKSRKDGRSAWCKSCDNASNKRYIANNREHIREYERNDYYKNHERHLRQHRESNERNKEKIKQARKEYYQQNRDEILARDRQYNQRHKKQISIRNQKYYQLHKEEFIFKARERKRRIRDTKDGTITKEVLDIMYESQCHKCDYCNGDLDQLGKHLDHILPLNRGGKHTLNNVHWICPRCNLSKNDKTEEEWFNMLKKQNKMIDERIIWDERGSENESA